MLQVKKIFYKFGRQIKVPQLLDAASDIVVATHLCESLIIKLKVHSGCSLSFSRSDLLTG